MSFFDEVETTVANTRFLQAVEEHAPIALQLQPIEELLELEGQPAACKPAAGTTHGPKRGIKFPFGVLFNGDDLDTSTTRDQLTIDMLLAPNTLAHYTFKQFLVSRGQVDAVQVLSAIDAFRRAAGRQRRDVASKLFAEHPALITTTPTPATDAAATSALPHSASASRTSGPGAAYLVTDASDVSVIHVSPAPTTASSTQVDASPSATAASPQSSPSSPTPAAPSFPCLELALAAPPAVHTCCAQLRTAAATDIDAIRASIASSSPSSSSPPLSLLDPLFDALRAFLASHMSPFLTSRFFSRLVQLTAYARVPPSFGSFRVFRVLGRGAFGAVSAVQTLDTRAIFAMKEMSKKMIKSEGSEWMVLNERRALARMASPFVLRLYASFHDEEKLYLVFDLCSGGDLKYHLRSASERCFEPQRVQFYAAEVLLGLAHIHAAGFLFRDLKSENILLSQRGHVVLSDLGLAVRVRPDQPIKHLAGTAGWWAPEVVTRTGTHATSDYWSFGVLIYEMLTGKRPVCVCDTKRTKEWCPFGQKRSMEENAVDPAGVLRLEVAYPPDRISPTARDLLERLFVPDPLKRLGAGGVHELQRHAFFDGIDWESLACLETTPPFVPEAHTVNAESIGEVGEFNKTHFKHITLTEEDEARYQDFPFVSPTGRQAEMLEAVTKMDHPDNARAPSEADQDKADGCCIIL